MNKIMMLLVMCTGFVATMPMSANALDPQVVRQHPNREPNLLIAQYVGVASPLENRLVRER
jgi:hypothetical protein